MIKIPPPYATKKILVLRYRSIGDIILANPALAGLRARFPKAEIHVVVDDVFEEVLFENPNVDRVITSPRGKDGSGLGADLSMIRKLRAEKYDVAVDLHGGPRSAWFSLFSGAKTRVGHGFRWRNKLCYNTSVPTPKSEDHTWRVQYMVVNAIGCEWPEKPEYFMHVTEDNKERVTARLEKEGFTFDRPIVLMHPGARINVKRWPAEKMGETARWLVNEKGAAVVLAGSAADAEEIKLIRRASGYALPFFTDLTLGELAALIQRCGLVIANDSGPMHMAGALNTPLIALFGPSDPAVWAPPGERRTIITPPPMECLPCDQKGCRYEGAHCMTKISVNDVKTAVNRLGVLEKGAEV